MSAYNYSEFDLAREEAPFARFGSRLHAGDQAPAFQLEDLATGRPVLMSSLWEEGLAVVEFGSFT